jgi:tripartite ATP-independent transporter DctM subunit
MTLTLVLILLFFLLISSPVSVALGLASVITMLIYQPVPFETIPQLLSNNSTSFIMVAVPLFILAGNLMERGTVGRNLIDFTTSIIGFSTGGLGAVNIVGSMLFGGISGSSLADTAVFGSILVPRMVEQQYPKDYAAAVTTTSSCLSVIIPPSINIVVAAAVTSQSVSRALAAGVLPGVLVTFLMCLPNYYLSKKHGYGVKIPFSFGNVVRTLRLTWSALLAPVIILGSIFSGIVTPTEAASITVLYIIVVDFVFFKKISLRDIWVSLYDTARMTSGILFIATSSAVASYILAYEGIPNMLAKILAAVPGGQFGFVILFSAFIIALGCVMDAGPIIIIFTPLFMPVATAAGIDPSHYLIMMVIGTAIGLTTPPYGVCLFSMSTVANISIEKIAKSSIPFYVSMIIALLLVGLWPPLTLALPLVLGL